MKKILCLIFIMLLVGCTQKTNVKPITRNISFTAEMTYYNEYYEMAVDIKKDGDMTVSMLHPEELQGLNFCIENGKTTAEYDGIKMEADDSYKTAATGFIYSVFKTEEQPVFKNDNRFFTKGACDGGEYKMYISEAGLPLKICDSADRFEIIIKNLKINKEKEP